MRKNRHFKLLAAALTLLALSLTPQAIDRASAQTTQIGPSSQTIGLEVNEGQRIRLSKPAATVFIANPAIADVNVKSPRLI